MDPILYAEIEKQPYPLLFVTVSGAHLYGFASSDSDFDLRGVHILPAQKMLGLDNPEETITTMWERNKIELDLVTHDIKKFFLLMLKPNGYVLEQVFSPIVMHTTPEHEELKSIAGQCITREHYRHYKGFALNQWNLFYKESPRRVKPLLYTYRVLLTGIHLLESGEIEANLGVLNHAAKLPYIDELIAQKTDGAEKEPARIDDLDFHEGEFQRLLGVMEQAYENCKLPEEPSCRDALDSLLLRLRLKVDD